MLTNFRASMQNLEVFWKLAIPKLVFLSIIKFTFLKVAQSKHEKKVLVLSL